MHAAHAFLADARTPRSREHAVPGAIPPGTASAAAGFTLVANPLLQAASQLSGGPPEPITWGDLEHVSLTRDFLNDPQLFLRHLLAD